MAPVEGGDGWARPSGAPTSAPVPPPGMPRFEAPAPPTLDPTSAVVDPWMPAPLPPPPPSPPPWAASTAHPIDPWYLGFPAPPDRRPWSMTQGWAWAALVAELLIPASIAASVAYVISVEAAYDPERDGFQEAWEILVVMLVLAVWVPACVVVATISAIIGTVRSRRHRHLRHAPAVAIVVWVVLGVLLVPFAALVLRTTVLS